MICSGQADETGVEIFDSVHMRCQRVWGWSSASGELRQAGCGMSVGHDCMDQGGGAGLIFYLI